MGAVRERLNADGGGDAQYLDRHTTGAECLMDGKASVLREFKIATSRAGRRLPPKPTGHFMTLPGGQTVPTGGLEVAFESVQKLYSLMQTGATVRRQPSLSATLPKALEEVRSLSPGAKSSLDKRINEVLGTETGVDGIVNAAHAIMSQEDPSSSKMRVEYACAELPRGVGQVYRLHTDWAESGKFLKGPDAALGNMTKSPQSLAAAMLPGSGALRRRAASGKVGSAQELFAGAGVTFALVQEPSPNASANATASVQTAAEQSASPSGVKDDKLLGPIGDLFSRVANAHGTSLDPSTKVDEGNYAWRTARTTPRRRRR